MQEAIWIAEDDAEDAELYASILSNLHPHRPVRFFNDGVEMLTALRGLDRSRKCLLIIDEYMPRLNGIDLIALLYQENLLCLHEVLLLTAGIGPVERSIAEQYTVPVQIKPASIRELEQMFARLVIPGLAPRSGATKSS